MSSSQALSVYSFVQCEITMRNKHCSLELNELNGIQIIMNGIFFTWAHSILGIESSGFCTHYWRGLLLLMRKKCTNISQLLMGHE